MFTPFRDGLQSVFGGKTRLQDILPAVEASAALGIRPAQVSVKAKTGEGMDSVGRGEAIRAQAVALIEKATAKKK